MQPDLVIQRGLTIAGAELDVQTSVGGGPGGQHVNKSATKVTLRWSLVESASLSETQRQRFEQKLASRLTTKGELIVQVHEHRSQQRNLDEARRRLAQWIVQALQVQKKRRPTKPTRASKKRRVDGKKRRGAVKKNRQRVSQHD